MQSSLRIQRRDYSSLGAVQARKEKQSLVLGQQVLGMKEATSDVLEKENITKHTSLDNPMDRRAWQATIHRVTKSQTQLKQLTMHTQVPFGATVRDKIGTVDWRFILKNLEYGTGDFLVVQWVRILLSTSAGDTGSIPDLQLLKPVPLKPGLCNKGGHHSENPMHHNEEQPQFTSPRQNLRAATKASTINKLINLKGNC